MPHIQSPNLFCLIFGDIIKIFAVNCVIKMFFFFFANFQWQQTAVYLASENNQQNIVKMLTDHSADVNIQNQVMFIRAHHDKTCFRACQNTENSHQHLHFDKQHCH